jgi:4,5-dihydroxyphthalate decarboxylase
MALELESVIGLYAHTQALRGGLVTSNRVNLNLVEYAVTNRAFKPAANDLAFQVSELALVTYMLARDLGQPLVGVPIVMMRQPAFASLVCRVDSKLSTPRDLEGGVIGVRSYTQTTGVWLRGIIGDEYGVDISKLRWTTLEGAHLEAYEDPPTATRAADVEKPLLKMLLDGDVDAAVGVDGAATNPELRTVIPDAERAEAEWTARTGIETINHGLVTLKSVADANPWLKDELVALLDRAKARMNEFAGGGHYPPGQVPGKSGLEPNRKAIDTLARYAYEQQITKHRFTVDELYPG